MAVPIPDGLSKTFPSLDWDDVDWLAAFELAPGLYESILNGIAGASAQWRSGKHRKHLPMYVIKQQFEVDRQLGITV